MAELWMVCLKWMVWDPDVLDGGLAGACAEAQMGHGAGGAAVVVAAGAPVDGGEVVEAERAEEAEAVARAPPDGGLRNAACGHRVDERGEVVLGLRGDGHPAPARAQAVRAAVSTDDLGDGLGRGRAEGEDVRELGEGDN